MTLSLIKQFMYENDNFAVPQFGSFKSKYSTSQITEQKQFVPKRKEFSFEENKDEIGQILINYIAQKGNISTFEAKNKLNELVKTTRQALEKNKSTSWQGIGTFYLNKDNVIIFRQDINENFVKNSYGLSSFKQRTTDSTTKSENTNWRNLLIILLIIILLLLLIFIPYYYYYYDKKDDTKTNKIENVNKDKNVDKDENVDKTPKQENIDNQEDLDTLAGYSRFYLIVGSFESKNEAEKMAKHQKSLSRDVQILPQAENGNYRVSIKYMTDSKVAIKELEEFRDNQPNTDIWLLPMK